MKRMSLLPLLFFFITLPCFGQSQSDPNVTASELKSHVYYLASDELEGRGTGTEGGNKAAAYIADQLKKAGLTLLGENGFQYFDVVKGIHAGDACSFLFGSFTGVLGTDFQPVALSSNASVTADVIFAGYGMYITTDSLQWDDYAGLDVTGKIVMILRDAPAIEGYDKFFEQNKGLMKKVLTAKDKGAAGIIFISGKDFDPEDAFAPLRYEQGQSGTGLPIIRITRIAANSIFAGSGKTIDGLEGSIKLTKKSSSFDIGTSVSFTVDLVIEKAKTQNVVAVLEGNDPVLKNEYIIIGAHYDHLGMGGLGSGSRTPDTIAPHNGADDNASGIASVIETAEFFASLKSLKRSLLVIAFSGEEMGLLGSKYFTQNPLVDIKQVKQMVNLDMVGRLDPKERAFTVGGTGTATGLDSLVMQTVRNYDVKVSLSPEGYGPSDHASFYGANIPVLYFFTGIHEDYHTPVDDADRINYDGQESVTKVVTAIVDRIANLSEPLAYKESGPKNRDEKQMTMKVSIGIMPDVTGSVQGVRADAVIEGKPGALAGMKKGDIIVAIDGKPVANIYEYMDRLSQYKRGQRINVDVLRDGKTVVLIVEL